MSEQSGTGCGERGGKKYERLGDVTPCLATHDVKYLACGDTKLGAEFVIENPASGVASANFPHIICGDLAIGALFTPADALRVESRRASFASGYTLRVRAGGMAIPRCRTTLCRHVRLILFAGTEEEMRGIAAARVVAARTVVAYL